MTDQEIICEFMEPRPTEPAPSPYELLQKGALSPDRWWEAGMRPHREWGQWYARRLTLDALHEVEARLTDEQWHKYDARFAVRTVGKGDLAAMKIYLNATAEEKITALAKVLRGAPREERRTQLEEWDDADVDRDGGAR